MRRTEIIAFTAAAFALATPAAAQGRGKGKAKQRVTSTQRGTYDIYGMNRTTTGRDRVPPGHLPPPGMCRVWIEGVPPGHQPPVTDCATAQAQRTANSRIIYGDETPFPGRGKNRSTSNGRVVNVGGRQCVERVDVYGNVRYECQNDRYDPRGIFTDRGQVYGRNGVYDRDDLDDDNARGARHAGKVKSHGKAKGKQK
jgi:hypothetical protein